MAKRPPSKRSKTSPAEQPKRTLTISKADFPGTPSREQLLSKLALSPTYTNATTANTFSKAQVGEEPSITESLTVMGEKVREVQAGDMSEMEGMMVAQAIALNSIFTEMARRAALNMGEYINAADTYMRLALKAQSQARATVETLAEIKNPRQVAFVRQANIANGPQQINNGESRARENKNPSNELSRGRHELSQDAGASSLEGRANQEMEAVGAVNRATN